MHCCLLVCSLPASGFGLIWALQIFSKHHTRETPTSLSETQAQQNDCLRSCISSWLLWEPEKGWLQALEGAGPQAVASIQQHLLLSGSPKAALQGAAASVAQVWLRAADTSSSFIRDICLHRPCKTGRLKLDLVPWHLARIISRCSVWVYPEGQAEAGAEPPACYSFLLCCSKWSDIMSISWRRGRCILAKPAQTLCFPNRILKAISDFG